MGSNPRLPEAHAPSLALTSPPFEPTVLNALIEYLTKQESHPTALHAASEC